MSPGPKCGERDRAAVGVLAHRAGVPGANDVAGVALVALAEHRLAASNRRGTATSATRARSSSPSAENTGHPAQQRDRVLAACVAHGAQMVLRARRAGSGDAAEATPGRAPARAGGGAGRRRRSTSRAPRPDRSGTSTASAISATPAATVSTRPASCAACAEREPAGRC